MDHEENDTKRVEAAEMCFYRRLLKVNLTDRRTNESVLNELSTSRDILNLLNKRTPVICATSIEEKQRT